MVETYGLRANGFTLLRKTLIYSHGEAKKILISSIRTITQNNLSIDNTYIQFLSARIGDARVIRMAGSARAIIMARDAFNSII